MCEICCICGKKDPDLIPVSYEYGHFGSEPVEFNCAECLDKLEKINEE